MISSTSGLAVFRGSTRAQMSSRTIQLPLPAPQLRLISIVSRLSGNLVARLTPRVVEQINKWPIPTDEISRFRALLPSKKPNKPYVFIFGQGLWNDLSLTETLKWVDEIHENSVEVAPWLEPTHGQRMLAAGTRSQVFWPRLFVTPNAAGRSKSDEYLKTQGNKKLMEFEEGVRIEGAKRGIEHLGTWNMSIQANKPDGT